MNKIIPISIIFLLVISSFVFAADNVPRIISIQGKLTDVSGDPVPNDIYTFDFGF
jgi:hypothetical protein